GIEKYRIHHPSTSSSSFRVSRIIFLPRRSPESQGLRNSSDNKLGMQAQFLDLPRDFIAVVAVRQEDDVGLVRLEKAWRHDLLSASRNELSLLAGIDVDDVVDGSDFPELIG